MQVRRGEQGLIGQTSVHSVRENRPVDGCAFDDEYGLKLTYLTKSVGAISSDHPPVKIN